jgi:hypothetical protein
MNRQASRYFAIPKGDRLIVERRVCKICPAIDRQPVLLRRYRIPIGGHNTRKLECAQVKTQRRLATPIKTKINDSAVRRRCQGCSLCIELGDRTSDDPTGMVAWLQDFELRILRRDQKFACGQWQNCHD